MKYKTLRVCAFLLGSGILSGLITVYAIPTSWLVTAAVNNDPMTARHATGLVLGLLGLYLAFGLSMVGVGCLMVAFSDYDQNGA